MGCYDGADGDDERVGERGKDELAELADPLTSLRDLMNDSYWDEARGPITDLVMNLMPQLEVVLTNASRAMGAFLARLRRRWKDQLRRRSS